MNAITLGKPNLYLKGMVKQIFRDRATGNIVGYDTVGSEFALTVEKNDGLIEGGFLNPVVKVIPDTVRASGTYTSQAFSLETRQLATGGELAYNGISTVCETIVATGTTLAVEGTPAKSYAQKASDTYGWCYVRESGAGEYQGTNYGINLTTKEVDGFTAVSGTSYDVIYFTNIASAQVLKINDAFNPADLSLEQVYAVFSSQNGSSTQGTRYANCHVVVPHIQLTGNPGLDGTQTENSTTDGSWMALSDTENADALCDSCTSGNGYMYYVMVPCAGATSEVESIAVPGGAVTVGVSATEQIPWLWIMPSGEPIKADYSIMTYEVADNSIATVNTSGQVTGVAAGTTTVTATLIEAERPTLTAICTIIVTA